ncbi:MAG: putative ubiquitin carboxyl-terminal hydrolase MINDY-1, partial [Streblomastix strix]
MNILSLKQLINLKKDSYQESELIAIMRNFLIEFNTVQPSAYADEIQLSLEKNLEDALNILPLLVRGLDINLRFDGIKSFEFSAEMLIFDLCNINLYHGQVIPPSDELYPYLKDKDLLPTGIILSQFIQNSSTQTTEYGLNQLKYQLPEGQLSILFKGNHYSVLTSDGGELFELVTAAGLSKMANIVWMRIDGTNNELMLCNADFYP